MNFVGKDTIQHDYSIDSGTGVLTIVFKDEFDVVIDTLTIESLRYRTFIGALDEVAKQILDDRTVGLEKSRTTFDKNSQEGVTEY